MKSICCWLFLGCENEDCPAYGLIGARCWTIEDTLCSAYNRDVNTLLEESGLSLCDFCPFRSAHEIDIEVYNNIPF